MKISVKTGDIFDEQVDVLICPANPQLNMSGGINGEILVRGGDQLQVELHAKLAAMGRKTVPPTTVVATGPGPLNNCTHIVHAVSIDVWYDSSPEIVARTIENALAEASQLGARTVRLPALATGYGHLSIEQFAIGLKTAIDSGRLPDFDELRVVVRQEPDADIIRSVLNKQF